MTEISNKEVLLADTIRTLPTAKKFPGVVSVLLLAPPGSGKFEIAERLQEELGLTHIKIDQLLSYLAPKSSFFEDLDYVQSFALEVAVELAKQGYSSVLDRNINKKGYREKFKVDLEVAGASLVEVEIDCPDEVALRNIAQDNVDITHGERAGNILDRPFFEFKKAQVEPPIGENRYRMSCQYTEPDWQRLTNFLKIKLVK